MYSVALLVLLLHSLLCLPVYAIPLDARQANNDKPRTVTSVGFADSPTGRDMVREVKSCAFGLNGNRSPVGSSSEIISTSSTTPAPLPPATSTSSLTAPSSSITLPPPSPTIISTPLPDVVGESSSISTGITSKTSSVQPSAAGVSAVPASDPSIPGRKLAVLPIGLGVFAGISLIALIIIAFVTYERTRYRKAFRQRKLAEAAAPMGYSGM